MCGHTGNLNENMSHSQFWQLLAVPRIPTIF